jgi:hypothetical protein
MNAGINNSRLFQSKKWKRTALTVALLTVTGFGYGCNSNSPLAPITGQGKATVPVAKDANVKSIEIVLQRYIPSDVVQFLLVPRDGDMFLVPCDGRVTAKLWLAGFHDEKDSIIQEWSDVLVKATDYNVLTGASVKLDFQKDIKLQNLMGILEVTFSLPDGRKFTTEKSDIPLTTAYECPCLL